MEYAVTPEEIGEYAKEAVEKAQEEIGEDACQHDIAVHTIGIGIDDMNAIAEYVSQCVAAHVYNQTVVEGPMNPHELTEAIIGVCVPTILMAGRMAFEGRGSATDQYLTTVHAEMSLNSMIEDKRDLEQIWPSQFVSEICDSYPDPTKAFLAGVICGRSRG
jgi:hypothetical protein